MYKSLLELTRQILILRGGPGSGNWGHTGRPGKLGGSGKGGGKSVKTRPTEGARVSEGFNYGTNLAIFYREKKPGSDIKASIDTIDSIHSDGDLPKVPMDIIKAKDFNGAYFYDSDGTPDNIGIALDSDHPRMTTVHEIGHFIDHQGIGKPGVFGTEPDNFDLATRKGTKEAEKVKALHTAIDKSRAIEALKTDVPNQEVTVPHPIFEDRKISYSADKEYVNYLLLPHEKFARAYAQYIATKSGDTGMKAELDKMRARKNNKKRIYYHEQWDDADFAPIGKAFDDLFGELGWIENAP